MTGIIINNNEYTVNTGSTKIEYNSTGNTVGYSIWGEEIPLGTAILTINPTPADAVVTINGQTTNSLMVTKGAPVTYTVSKTDYITKTGTTAIFSDETINATLIKSRYDYTAGTYEVDLISGLYKITAVSGGAGGAACVYVYGSTAAATASGNSGCGIIATFNLPEGRYEIGCGSGGDGKRTAPTDPKYQYDTTTAYSSAGGTTYIKTSSGDYVLKCQGPGGSSAYYSSRISPNYRYTVGSRYDPVCYNYLVSTTYSSSGNPGRYYNTVNENITSSNGPLYAHNGNNAGYGGYAYGFKRNGYTPGVGSGGAGEVIIEYLGEAI